MEIETERLLLRPFKATDLPDLQRYAVRLDFYRYLPIPVQTSETVAAFLAGQLAAQEDGTSDQTCVLETKEMGTVIGTVRLGIKDEAHRSGDLGYALDSDFQGQGYMTEAVRAVIERGFGEFALRRIWATADIRNERSWRVLERCGLSREGMMRDHKLVRGEWRDSYLYAILATDPRPEA